MHFVAVSELASDLDSEAYAIASALGFTAYDVKMRLTGVLPRVVLTTMDVAAAAHAGAVIRARGNAVVSCDSRLLPSATSLPKMHRFTFDANGLRVMDVRAQEKFLAWSELAVVVVVAARTDVFRTTIEKSMEHRGLSTHDRETERVEHEHVLDRAAYLFSAPNDDGTIAPPWLLHEREAQYLALGPRMKMTRRENFLTTIEVLRENARGATIDERFVQHPLASNEIVSVAGYGSAEASTAPRGIEVMVYLLAQSLLRSRGGPYRAVR